MRYYSAWTRLEPINDHLLSSNESVLEIASISLVISSKAKKMHQKACYQCSEGTAAMKERRLQAIFQAASSSFTAVFTNSQHLCSNIVNSAFSYKLKSSSISTFEQIAIILSYSFPISADREIAVIFSITLLLVYCEESNRFLSNDNLIHYCSDESRADELMRAILLI